MLKDYYSSIASFALIQILGVISPGPTFALAVRNSLMYSRKTALLTVLGICLGSIVHISYVSVGLGYVILKTPWLLGFIKYLGGTYILFLGIKGILAQKKIGDFDKQAQNYDLSAFSAIGAGFLTCATNPNAIMYYLSITSLLISPKTPSLIIEIYMGIIFITTLVWFLILAFSLSNARLQNFCIGFQHIIERVAGIFLIFLGLKIFLKN